MTDAAGPQPLLVTPIGPNDGLWQGECHSSWRCASSSARYTQSMEDNRVYATSAPAGTPGLRYGAKPVERPSTT